MKCALCGKIGKLVNSHIIPEWVYTDLYDEKHRLPVVSTLKEKTRPFEQKGIREKLLCNDCEQKLSVFERYVRGVIKGGESVVIHEYPDKLEITGINYTFFKLFQLSILWRAGIAKNKMFSRVQLGPHENKLRDMINAEDPGASNQYGCLMFIIISDKGVVVDFIDQSEQVRIEGMRCFRFIFSGFVWAFLVASHEPDSRLTGHMLSQDGTISILKRQFENLDYLKKFAKNISEQ